MKPNFNPIRVTIVDLMGVFLPGIIWSILFLTAAELFGISRVCNDIISPFNPVSFMEYLLQNTPGKAPLSSSFYLTLILTSLLSGYIAKGFVTMPSEYISSLPVIILNSFKKLFQKNKNAKNSRQNKCFRFPYAYLHKNRTYFTKINELLESDLEIKPNDLPRDQPFSSCKRLLRLYVPTFWEEVEHLEAEVRMFGSLFTASLFSLVLAGIEIFFYQNTPVNAAWIFLSIFFSLVLGFIFRRRRKAEVSYVYLNTSLSLPLIRNSINETSGKKV